VILLFEEDAMKRLALILLAAAIVVTMIAVPGACGQSASERSAPQGVTAFGFGPAGSVISTKQHAPFSAVLVEQMEQTLNDGIDIARENQEVVMRDGMGRIYRGRQMKRPAGKENASLMQITITDPVRHLQYLCTPIMKVCTKMGYRMPPGIRQSRAAEPGKGKDVTVEDLGSSSIGGIDVEGKRVTRVIPEGSVGNDRPFTTIEEVWRSKELDVDVQLKRNDPRMGMRTTTMTEVSLSEPDPKYFQIPEGYHVVEPKRPTGALAPLPAGGETSYPPEIAPPNH
jgi:hypothetical protein